VYYVRKQGGAIANARFATRVRRKSIQMQDLPGCARLDTAETTSSGCRSARCITRMTHASIASVANPEGARGFRSIHRVGGMSSPQYNCYAGSIAHHTEHVCEKPSCAGDHNSWRLLKHFEVLSSRRQGPPVLMNRNQVVNCSGCLRLANKLPKETCESRGGTCQIDC